MCLDDVPKYEKAGWKKRKPFVIGSRIRERDKKNTEYYVGDYLVDNIAIA